ncbi:hypothetical protein BDN72DRAFT_545681 [Pluteus cervinus]|uniref:Uncharacterized protein n=1 Tax=Pluteus cervinus TaxID=181527 RepID=A0ACD3A5P9_9AGAR|nr:hypothetical protein BDN72DRAFT_545681 [Pluteus cervinus]
MTHGLTTTTCFQVVTPPLTKRVVPFFFRVSFSLFFCRFPRLPHRISFFLCFPFPFKCSVRVTVTTTITCTVLLFPSLSSFFIDTLPDFILFFRIHALLHVHHPLLYSYTLTFLQLHVLYQLTYKFFFILASFHVFSALSLFSVCLSVDCIAIQLHNHLNYQYQSDIVRLA